MRASHWARKGSRGKIRNEVLIVEPTPAALSPAGTVGLGGGMRWSAISFVPLDAGMIRGMFSGFEKNANTRSSGKGTHCSNSRWLAMRIESAYIQQRVGQAADEPETCDRGFPLRTPR